MPSGSFRFAVADVFTDTPLEGNQLCVFTDARDVPEHLLQPLAKEIGFAETVFVYPPEEGGHARLLIFTRESQIPFAVYPVLGTAFVLRAGRCVRRAATSDRVETIRQRVAVIVGGIGALSAAVRMGTTTE